MPTNCPTATPARIASSVVGSRTPPNAVRNAFSSITRLPYELEQPRRKRDGENLDENHPNEQERPDACQNGRKQRTSFNPEHFQNDKKTKRQNAAKVWKADNQTDEQGCKLQHRSRTRIFLTLVQIIVRLSSRPQTRS